MHIEPKLSKEEFKDLHNGLCKIRHLEQQLQGLLAPEIVAELTEGLKLVDKALAATYEADDAKFNELSNYYDGVANRQGLKTTWSVYEVEVGAMGHTAFGGTVKLIYTSISGGKSTPIELEDPSWLQLWKAAEKIMTESGTHHRFIEDFTRDGNIVTLHTGS